MSEHELDSVGPLEPELRTLIAAERASPGMPAEVQTRLLQRLRLNLPGGGGEGGGGESSPSPAAVRPSRRLPWSQAAVLGAGTYALGLVTGAMLHARLSQPTMPAPAARAAPERPPTVLPALPPPAPSISSKRPEAAAPSVGSAAALRAEPPPRPESGRDADLAAESALIERARAALLREQIAATLEALQQHQRRFPAGRLAEEREGLWIQALVSSGQSAAARTRAEKFRRLYPDSLLLPMVDAALRSLP